MTDTAELIERLRSKGTEEAEFWEQDPMSHDLVQAASRLASLQEEVERLKAENIRREAALMKVTHGKRDGDGKFVRFYDEGELHIIASEALKPRSALSPVSEGEGWTPTHRHEKSGKSYRKIGQALHTESKELLVVYSTSAGVWYARPKDMFEDGRFVDVSEGEG